MSFATFVTFLQLLWYCHYREQRNLINRSRSPEAIKLGNFLIPYNW